MKIPMLANIQLALTLEGLGKEEDKLVPNSVPTWDKVTQTSTPTFKGKDKVGQVLLLTVVEDEVKNG